MKRFSGLFVCLAMVVATSVSSFAGYTGAGGGISGGFSYTPDTTPLGVNNLSNPFATTNFNTDIEDAGTGDFADAGFDGVTFFSGPYNFGTGPISIGTAVNLGSTLYGTFVGTVTADSGNGLSTQLSRQVRFVGTYTPGSSGLFNSNTTPLTNTVFQFTISKGEETGNVSRSWSLDTTGSPQAAVPEPASLAIFGLGAAGFAARRFRRK
jgi:hypothetical protein